RLEMLVVPPEQGGGGQRERRAGGEDGRVHGAQAEAAQDHRRREEPSPEPGARFRRPGQVEVDAPEATSSGHDGRRLLRPRSEQNPPAAVTLDRTPRLGAPERAEGASGSAPGGECGKMRATFVRMSSLLTR